jgi:2'-hydroxyisoflavone reductase
VYIARSGALYFAPMNLLILGGTIFLGRAIVEDALARGHQVTIFTRGKSLPETHGNAVTRITGDRLVDHAPIANGSWDAVIDTSAYVPRVARDAARTLHQHVPLYCFVSSVSVYAELPQPGMDEHAPLARLADPSTEEITGETYGALKALCEEAVQEVYGDRAIIVRPGLIVGRYDRTDRFTYWPMRVARGGEVLAPGNPDAPVQIIDVRDLAEWIVTAVEQRTAGVFNAVGPASPCTMRDMLHACHRVTKSNARFTWIDDAFLLEHNAGPWMEIPLWIPSEEEQKNHMSSVSPTRVITAGLRYRTLDDTIADTLAWEAQRPADHRWRAGLAAEKEATILNAWGSAIS